jgi:predicted rRNA methylase YqxC with S4 and FtsJ domains
MAKPQFEAGEKQKSGGVIKNAAIRREILSNLEFWLKTNKFVILKKADSQIAGEKGNLERFYSLKVEKK